MREQIAFGRIVRSLLRGAHANQRETGKQQALAAYRSTARAPGRPFPVSSKTGMLGGQPLLRIVEFRCLAVGVLKSFERADRFVLVQIRRRDRATLPPSSARRRWHFSRFRSWCRRSHRGRGFSKRRNRAAARAGGVDDQLALRRQCDRTARQDPRRKYRARQD